MEQRFLENEKEKPVFKKKLQTKIDFALCNRKIDSLEKLKIELQRSAITMVLRQNEAGLTYGITYVDFANKCVFNGSSLGKAYSAKGILARCENGTNQKLVNVEEAITKTISKETKQTACDAMAPTTNPLAQHTPFSLDGLEIVANKMTEMLFRDEQGFDFLPYELRQEGKKKKKRRLLRKHL